MENTPLLPVKIIALCPIVVFVVGVVAYVGTSILRVVGVL